MLTDGRTDGQTDGNLHVKVAHAKAGATIKYSHFVLSLWENIELGLISFDQLCLIEDFRISIGFNN